ncbi:cytochrome b [Mesorhizobium sp.]|uniref:cytochrome b n=1 Tax=Mesorhizobium sp. TaxID=1871066 RepID=UPI000FE8C0A4|nr:cytochrome b [Mesorhizobium sp.]RWM35223.1 MAG: cytochrome b [Mesorhizobium sp.]TJV49247.1 MAG: cytochrome b [Mesorhizobium sp.]
MALITTYNSTQKFLHWALFALVILLYALTYGEEFYSRGDPAVDAIWRLHISFGLLLAAFVLWRVVLRGLRGTPGLPAEMSRLEQTAAKAGHVILYGLLIALPVLGILLTWFRGDALSFFGLFAIPSPFTPDKATARNIRELHELCANGILIAAGLHALAALYHHFVRRDGVLARMLPGG